MEVIAGDPGLLDHVQAWSTFVAALAAVGALWGVYFVLRKDRRQARMETGPYIRVDIFPADPDLGDFDPPDPHYETKLDLVDLAADLTDEAASTFAACFRNYQQHALDMAFRVDAFFVLEIRRAGSNEPEYLFSRVPIPYVEHEKPVMQHLFRIPRNCSATVWLSNLAYADFFDTYYEHTYGENEAALHGRLICKYDGSGFRSIPDGRPAGEWYTHHSEE